jgi:hypothetical protein
MWVRFGRNEPKAPAGELPGKGGIPIDLDAFRRDGTLVLLFAPPGGFGSCSALIDNLANASLVEHEAELLLASPERADLGMGCEIVVGYDEAGSLRARYAGLMEVDASGGPLLFVLDRDGSPVYAWVGECGRAGDLAAELSRKLRSASFLCPECSVPDPGSSVMWDVIY